jgi:hypothetical protein
MIVSPIASKDSISLNPESGRTEFTSFGMTYIIQVAGKPNLVLDIAGGSTADGGKVIIWEPNGGDNQKFKVKGKTITSVKSKKVLDASGGLKQGAGIIQYGPHGGPNQQWVYDRATKTIKSTTQNLVLDVKGGNLNKGGEVIAWAPNNGPNQKWELVPVVTAKPAKLKGTFLIQVAGNPGLVLDVAGGSTADNAKLIIWGPNGGENQKFKIKGTTIKSVKSGKVVDASGGLKQGAGLIQYGAHGGPNQQWAYDAGTKTIKSTTQNLVVDVKGGNLKPGGEVIVWPPNNGPNQKWELIPVAKAGKQAKISGTFLIQIANNPGLVLDVTGGSTADNAKLIIWGPNGGDNQKFKIKGTTISSVKSGKVVDAAGGLKQGAGLIQFGAHGGANQQWQYDPATQTIKSTSENLVLDVKGGNLKPGGEVIVWPPNNGPNQKWVLVPI